METDERPSKIRKLSVDGQTHAGFAAGHSPPSQPPENGTSSLIGSASGGNEPPAATSLPEPSLDGDENQLDADDESVDGLPPPDETAPILNAGQPSQDEPPLSKNKLRKVRRKAEAEARRGERKIIRKEKLVAKRERIRAEKQRQAAEGIPEPKKPPRKRSVQLPITIAIDCDFDDLMLDNERVSLAGQITRCYSDNRNSVYRAHIVYCSFGGQLKERFDTVLEENYKSFKGVRALGCDFVETAEQAKEWMAPSGDNKLDGMFSKYSELSAEELEKLKDDGEVVYLSSEASTDLTELKPFSTYIIGGLVDKNREKGICYKRATQRGIRTARLPIGEFMQMQSRKVLATNHVNEIMLKWLESGDWGDAFSKVIPKRKGGTLKKAEAERAVEDEDAAGEDAEDETRSNEAERHGDVEEADEQSGGGVELSAAAEDGTTEPAGHSDGAAT